MEAANTAPPEPCSDPKPTEAAKAPPREKKTGILLELEVMAKLVKLVEEIKDIQSMIRIIQWLNDVLGQRVDAHRAAQPQPEATPDNHAMTDLLSRMAGR